jgi:hypothetical protein
MNPRATPPQSETNAEADVATNPVSNVSKFVSKFECFTNFPTQVKTTRPDGRAPPPVAGPAHSRPEPSDHGLRAALRAVLSRAGRSGRWGRAHTRSAHREAVQDRAVNRDISLPGDP